MYPNPTNGKIDVNYNIPTGKNPRAYLYDLMGKLMATENLIINDGTKALNLKIDFTNLNLPQGIYLLRIDLGNENISNQKLIINN